MSFIPVFTQPQPQHKQPEQHSTSDTIPDSCLILNPAVQQLLSKPTPICILSSVLHSEQARKFVRSVFFSNNSSFISEDDGPVVENPGSFSRIQNQNTNILLYNKMQTGYNNDGQAITWLYLQTNLNNQQKYVNMLSCVSCIVVYESQSVEIDRIYFERTVNNFKQITNKNPILFYLTNPHSKSGNQGQLISKYKCHEIVLQKQKSLESYSNLPLNKINSMKQIQEQSLSSSKAQSRYLSQSHCQLYSSLSLEDASMFQTVIQTNRKIMKELFHLQLSKDSPISCAVIPHMFKKWDKQSSFGEVEKPINIYKHALKQVQSQLKQICIRQYRNRMHKLYEDKKFISMKLLRNSHQLANQMAIKLIQKYKLPLPSFGDNNKNIVEEVQKILKQQLSRILEQTLQINMKWGKSFIEAEYSQIQSRLKNKELRQINSLKNQFNLFAEYFQKKVQNLSCKKLQIHFEMFLIEKIFECCSFLYENQKKNTNNQVTQLKSKLSNAQNELKQSKRQLIRQSNQSCKNIQALNFQLTSQKTREQLLQSTITHLKKCIADLQSQHQLKQCQTQQSYTSQLQQLSNQKSHLHQQLSTHKHTISILQSQIQKQKQMHKQTQQHYSLMIQSFKSKEMELMAEISQMEARTNKELEEARNESMRSMSQSTINRSQKEKQGARLQQELAQFKFKYGQIQIAYHNIQYELELARTTHQTQKTDLQLNLNLLQQKLYEYQSRQPRYQKLQTQLQSYQSNLEYYNQKLRQTQKQTALLKQQNQFINQQFKQIQTKYEVQKSKNQEMKGIIQLLEDKVGKMNKVKVNQWVQTQCDPDHKLRTMLEQAVKMVGILQTQYNKVKLQNTKLRYRMNKS